MGERKIPERFITSAISVATENDVHQLERGRLNAFADKLTRLVEESCVNWSDAERAAALKKVIVATVLGCEIDRIFREEEMHDEASFQTQMQAAVSEGPMADAVSAVLAQTLPALYQKYRAVLSAGGVNLARIAGRNVVVMTTDPRAAAAAAADPRVLGMVADELGLGPARESPSGGGT